MMKTFLVRGAHCFKRSLSEKSFSDRLVSCVHVVHRHCSTKVHSKDTHSDLINFVEVLLFLGVMMLLISDSTGLL